jgi:hypothetical protein
LQILTGFARGTRNVNSAISGKSGHHTGAKEEEELM